MMMMSIIINNMTITLPPPPPLPPPLTLRVERITYGDWKYIRPTGQSYMPFVGAVTQLGFYLAEPEVLSIRHQHSHYTSRYKGSSSSRRRRRKRSGLLYALCRSCDLNKGFHLLLKRKYWVLGTRKGW